MLLPEPLTAKPHFNICVSSAGVEGEEYLEGVRGPVLAEGGERGRSGRYTNKTAAAAASRKVDIALVICLSRRRQLNFLLSNTL